MHVSKMRRLSGLEANGEDRSGEAGIGCDDGILYIDKRCLTRDCISGLLASLLSPLRVEPATSVRDIAVDNHAGKNFSLAVLHIHAAGVSDYWVAAEMSRLRQIMPDVPITLLADNEEAESILDAFEQGIRGYIPTSLSMKHAAEAIRFICVGGTFIPPSAITQSARTAVADIQLQASQHKPLGSFTPRQREVLGRLWQGKPNKAIAYELHMCESTVKVHIRHIMKKLNATNRTQIVLLTHPPMLEERIPSAG